jgi:hypothetical protein
MSTRIMTTALAAVISLSAFAPRSSAVEGLWRREISYQSKNDLFANYYEGPNPSGVPVGMYVSPRPVPAYVGHTYTTYQPFMPHEYLYAHKRSHYAHCPGAGWSRAKIRYGTAGLRCDHWWWNMKGDHCLYPF